MNLIVYNYWLVECFVDRYYISDTHFAYITEFSKHYEKVILVCPVLHVASAPSTQELTRTDQFELVCLPPSTGHVDAYRHFFVVLKQLKKFDKSSTVYLRIPDPLRWLPWILGFRNLIYHYVGDQIAVAKQNAETSWFRFRSKLLIARIGLFILRFLTVTDKSARLKSNGAHLLSTRERSRPHEVVTSSILREQSKPNLALQQPRRGFLTVSHLRAEKNIASVIQFIGALDVSDPDRYLEIIGDGPERIKLEKLTADLGLTDVISFRGHIDGFDNLTKFFLVSKYFIFASKSEGSPRVILEAMGAGCVIITTNVGSLADNFHDCEHVFYVQSPAAEHFYEKYCEICKLYSKQLPTIVSKNYDLVWSTFTLEKFIKSIIRVNA